MPDGGRGPGRAGHHLGRVDEPQVGSSASDAVAHADLGGRCDPGAIDLGAVGGIQISQDPAVAIGRQFGMPAADAAIGQRHGLR